jgi:hypothetical protein
MCVRSAVLKAVGTSEERVIYFDRTTDLIFERPVAFCLATMIMGQLCGLVSRHGSFPVSPMIRGGSPGTGLKEARCER